MSSSVSTEPAPSAGPAPEGSRPTVSLRRRLLFLGIGVVLATALGVGLFSTRGSGSKSGLPRAGDQVPAMSMARLGGGSPVTVPGNGGGNGKPAVLLFFASWCTPCTKEIPALAHAYRAEQAAHSRLASVPILGVDGNDPTTSALAFVRKAQVTFPVGVDPDYSITEGKFGFTGLPEAVFVRKDGTIAAIHYGALSPAALRTWQHRLLAT